VAGVTAVDRVADGGGVVKRGDADMLVSATVVDTRTMSSSHNLDFEYVPRWYAWFLGHE